MSYEAETAEVLETGSSSFLDDKDVVVPSVTEKSFETVMALLRKDERDRVRYDGRDTAFAKAIKMLGARGVPIIDGMPVTRDSAQIQQNNAVCTVSAKQSATREDLLAQLEKALQHTDKMRPQQKANAENILDAIANPQQNITVDFARVMQQKIAKLAPKSENGHRKKERVF